MRRRSENAARGRGDLWPLVHVGDQLPDRVGLDHRAGVELIAKLRAQLGADPLEKERMGMELAAIFVFHADRKIDLVRVLARRSKTGQHLVDALAREVDGLAERRKRAPRVDDPDLAEKLHDFQVDAIAPVSDDNDAGSCCRLGRRQSLAADAQEQRGEAVSEELEGLVVKRDAHDVLEPAFDPGGPRGEIGWTPDPRFRLERLVEVEDAAANVGGGNGFCSAP